MPAGWQAGDAQEKPTMEVPAFFAAAPRIAVRDPLAKFLGAAADGLIEYQYADVVKLAGHSCPTVASAYLMTRGALKALYPDALPVRGEIRLELRDELRFTRVDSGANVTVSAQLDRVPPDPRVALLLPKCLDGVASAQETAVFQWLWQGRVRTLLLDCADDPEVIIVKHGSAA